MLFRGAKILILDEPTAVLTPQEITELFATLERLKKDGVSRSVPYGDDCTDRDTTLKSIQEYVSPKYQIRWYMESLGSDTLAFCIGLTSQWEQLEQEFGAENVAFYFSPVQADSAMFEMDMDEVFEQLEQRGEA